MYTSEIPVLILSRSVCDYRRGMDWWMDLLTTWTPLGSTSNYSDTANFHNSQITTPPSKSFTACCLHKPLPGNGFYSGDSSLLCAQILSSQLSRVELCPLRITSRSNTPFPTVNLLLPAHSLPQEHVYRAVAQIRSLFKESPLSNGSIRHNILNLPLTFTGRSVVK
jgi:hypothetical protein